MEIEKPVKRGRGRPRKWPKAEKRAIPKTVSVPLALGNKKNEDLATPQALLDQIRKEFGDFFDPCPLFGRIAAQENPHKNGLLIDWKEVNFVNPPFKETEHWVRKAIAESLKGRKSIFLIVARLSNKYWREIIVPFASEIRFFLGRMTFDPTKPAGLPLPVCLVIFDPQKPKKYKVQEYGENFVYWTQK